MTHRPVKSQPIADANAGGLQTADDPVAFAASLCNQRGAQLTAHRRRVLELLWEATRPMGAYELIQALNASRERPVGPPTVYRALEFLLGQGLVSRIESRNAFVPCAHPERPHDCIFFVCGDCGASAEVEEPRLERLLVDMADDLGYQLTRRVVEVEGSCADCKTTSAC